MSKFKIILLFGLLSIFNGNIVLAQRQQQIPKKNIEKFALSAFTRTVNAGDSLQVLIYMRIPNSTLQYVKLDTSYIARYEAVIALQTNKGKQLGREIWQDSIIVNDYNSTNSILDNKTLMISFIIPAGKYKVVASLLDLDTKNIGENTIKMNLSDYSKNHYLHKPILLNKSDENWGFGDNQIPAIDNNTFDIDEGLTFYLSGKVLPGKFTLNTQFIDKEEKVLFEKTITDTSLTAIFTHIVNLPKEHIEGIGIKVKTELIQGKYSIEKTKNVIIRKTGISHLISNLDEALQQMRYILNSEERREIKKVSSKKTEALFKRLWKSRDPSPDTAINELMNEYYKRVAYSNIHFDSFIDGWETDRGMIYIIFGPPDEIDKFMVQQRPEPYETWQYYRIQESFIFVGDNFGHYRLTTPFLGYQR
ncbi:MAG: GWxTD domain-containing protein [Candidatus Marinimicrobia bacterium]|nr:GWxTD domain-containing protein [Candidatus Neomarinimicrobiota bacterium]